MDTLLITGGSGFVGGRLARALSPGYRVLAPRHTELDLTNAAALTRYVQTEQPRFIIHAAALSDTGYCQAHPAESEAVNLRGPAALAAAAQAVGAKLVFFSSDQVYNGTLLSGPLPETAPTALVNIYGRHKLEAERRVLEACPEAVCLRASWMYDLPVQGLKNNTGLPGRLWLGAARGEPLPQNALEYRGVTWAGAMVEQMERFLRLPGGVYNAGAENRQNSLESGRALAGILGLPAATVCPAQALPGRNLSMDTSKLKTQGVDLGDTQTSLRRCLAAYGLTAYGSTSL